MLIEAENDGDLKQLSSWFKWGFDDDDDDDDDDDIYIIVNET